MRRDRGLDVFQAIDGDAPEKVLERAAQQGTELDEDQAEVLTGAAIDAPLLSAASLGECSLEIGQGQSTTTAERDVPGITEPPPHPGRQRSRQAPDRRGDGGHRMTDLRRSFRTSTTIGTRERTITT